MIKVIAFDLVGVLVRENDYRLDDMQSRIERLFGPNRNDDEFMQCVKENILNSSHEEIINITKHIINSIYDAKISIYDLRTFKNKHNNIKLVVATNHVSFVKEYIQNTFKNIFDNIYISSNIHKIKPESNFYLEILQDQNISPEEMLFLDDSINNIKGATNCGINTIHITKESNIFKEIDNYL